MGLAAELLVLFQQVRGCSARGWLPDLLAEGGFIPPIRPKLLAIGSLLGCWSPAALSIQLGHTEALPEHVPSVISPGSLSPPLPHRYCHF